VDWGISVRMRRPEVCCGLRRVCGIGIGFVEEKTWKLELRDLGSYYRLRRKLTSDACVRRLERTVERILGQDFEFVELETGKRYSLE